MPRSKFVKAQVVPALLLLRGLLLEFLFWLWFRDHRAGGGGVPGDVGLAVSWEHFKETYLMQR